ncbi:hypothetical protein [Methylobacterium organophilum]|uniref:Uncharacterized protein n=1 Tax=Methylobacterium organophilum TaxID=410 RepID=A0ABQ4T8H2_METOR|nr:hypothetical protein [Methylobacterium organophilum]GJE27987.1 hypothetical protein LKMONMHP_2849 [Methylobacterium organophilum]
MSDTLLSSDLLPPKAAAWQAALSALQPSSPCPNLSGEDWRRISESALDFIDRFGAEAAHYGWSDVELFGVHPDLGTMRTCWCGALMLPDRRVTAVSEDRISFDTSTYYRDLPGRPHGIPIWEFAARRSARIEGMKRTSS